ncbi:MAG: tRNA pseudouridine(13) synthase TruD [Candidatus Asgardarchaeia archaeon]
MYKCHPVEKIIGINVYVTDTVGIGGALRRFFSDFLVDEITLSKRRASSFINFNSSLQSGKYTHFLIRKVNWATVEAMKLIARKLHIGFKRLSFAGNKDKRAYVYQLGSAFNVPRELMIRKYAVGLDILNAWYSSAPIRLGELWGNYFKIVVRDTSIDQKDLLDNIKATYDILKKIGGAPNFFGHQRFGVHRPITHIIGKYIIKQEYENATKLLLGEIFELEGEDAKRARILLKESGWNYKKALREFPPRLKTEVRILHYLIKHENDYKGALRSLPSFDLFIHAFQAYVFNESLSYRIKKGYPLNKAIEGDLVIQLDNLGLPISYPYIAKKANLDKINNMILKGKLAVALPLVGSRTILPENSVGDFINYILDVEKIEKDMFQKINSLSKYTKGAYRPILTEIYWEREPYITKEGTPVFEFSLKKSSYATVVMREFMKTNPRNYV